MSSPVECQFRKWHSTHSECSLINMPLNNMLLKCLHKSWCTHTHTYSHKHIFTHAQAIWQFWQMSKGFLSAMACRKSLGKCKNRQIFVKEYESWRARPFLWLQHHQMLSSMNPIYSGKEVINDSVMAIKYTSRKWLQWPSSEWSNSLDVTLYTNACVLWKDHKVKWWCETE